MTFEHARAVADAILYEGYVLYPYRASSKKNQWRWQFGLLAPRGWSEAGGCEPWMMQAECLLETARPAEDAPLVLRGCVRGLRVQRRQDTAEGRSATTWDEGVEVELPFSLALGGSDGMTAHRVLDIELSGERTEEPGCVRELLPLSLRLIVAADAVLPGRGLGRVSVRVENHTAMSDSSVPRNEAMTSALAGVHVLLSAERGLFVSSIDPPEWAAEASRTCENKGSYPVLVGRAGARDEMLASPIILYDHPAIAPESPGDLCDATEIDEILTLRTFTLTDEEKREARLTDARAAAIVDRVDAMPMATFAKLHGARRDPAPASDGTQSPALVSPLVSPRVPLRVTPGARVRLRPQRRADAQDMFLTGRIATVEQVKEDVDGNAHVAVTVDDDPATEFHRWYGRFLYFSPEEVELLDVHDGGES